MITVSDLVSLVSLVVSIISAAITTNLFRLSKRQISGDVLFNIIQRMEEPQLREARLAIYALDRDGFLGWDNTTRQMVDHWGAELDVLATLLSQEGDLVAFFLLYGDVTMRSVYQIAPYGNHQRASRGGQFWLPLQRFANVMLGVWKKLGSSSGYVTSIGLPGATEVILTCKTFRMDHECRTFLGGLGLSRKSGDKDKIGKHDVNTKGLDERAQVGSGTPVADEKQNDPSAGG